MARGSEWGFKPRVLVLPEFTEEALFSRILAKCFSGRLVALQWGRQEAGGRVVFPERVRTGSQIPHSGFPVFRNSREHRQ